jgi:hypothetical protein
MIEIELQRRYYAETAHAYDSMHEDDSPSHAVALSMMLAFVDLLGIRSILDVGSGTGRVLRYIKERRPDILVCGVEPGFHFTTGSLTLWPSFRSFTMYPTRRGWCPKCCGLQARPSLSTIPTTSGRAALPLACSSRRWTSWHFGRLPTGSRLAAGAILLSVQQLSPASCRLLHGPHDEHGSVRSQHLPQRRDRRAYVREALIKGSQGLGGPARHHLSFPGHYLAADRSRRFHRHQRLDVAGLRHVGSGEASPEYMQLTVKALYPLASRASRKTASASWRVKVRPSTRPPE